MQSVVYIIDFAFFSLYTIFGLHNAVIQPPIHISSECGVIVQLPSYVSAIVVAVAFVASNENLDTDESCYYDFVLVF